MANRSQRDQDRQRLAYEAARLMAEQGHQDHTLARHKAAARLGIQDPRLWPRNSQIQAALLEQQRLFRPDQGRELATLRRLALQAMGALAPFRPRLVGSVLAGTADRASAVRLHLFADSPDAVLHALMDQRIPWEEQECLLRYPDGTRRSHPLLGFLAEGRRLELVILPPLALRNPPLDPVTERPERGAGVRQVQALLEATPPEPPWPGEK